jgi:hypothetical protein
MRTVPKLIGPTPPGSEPFREEKIASVFVVLLQDLTLHFFQIEPFRFIPQPILYFRTGKRTKQIDESLLSVLEDAEDSRTFEGTEAGNRAFGTGTEFSPSLLAKVK